MWDLAIAAFVLATLSSATLLAGWLVAGRWSWQSMAGLTAVVLASLLVFVFRFHGTWQMARVVPFSGALILGNWIPIGGAFLAGVMLRQPNSPPWRRGMLAGMILLVSAYSVVCCFQGGLPIDPPGPALSWTHQSQASSCGPCCAAILLRYNGIDVTEKEILRLCLTSYRGCPALGLYRGLKLKTVGTQWDVEVVSCSVEDLMETPGPLLLRIEIQPMIRLEGEREVTERRTYQHAVLFMGVDDHGRALILDPAIYRDTFSRRDVENLRKEWLGEALRLVPRD